MHDEVAKFVQFLWRSGTICQVEMARRRAKIKFTNLFFLDFFCWWHELKKDKQLQKLTKFIFLEAFFIKRQQKYDDEPQKS